MAKAKKRAVSDSEEEYEEVMSDNDQDKDSDKDAEPEETGTTSSINTPIEMACAAKDADKIVKTMVVIIIDNSSRPPGLNIYEVSSQQSSQSSANGSSDIAADDGCSRASSPLVSVDEVET
ncbi:uncharacterized protein STEHIDRAFT_114131 [Stereum hirsutum FP-91666 SS1]|uniref:uncharacterized protein n=1 Tax=Stereum hirsutum (strain FP-91666) TaxID=721885 RepID=UPI000444A640|nr:uncharacterized protein STEHIDRAFT_114131 [Stereum hirsutum FP-91666 SS1]EIM83115.1 hypothetical protein STEHIDRAFT_114131 [Stereum hirsutum FP-91666 SS1]